MKSDHVYTVHMIQQSSHPAVLAETLFRIETGVIIYSHANPETAPGRTSKSLNEYEFCIRKKTYSRQKVIFRYYRLC